MHCRIVVAVVVVVVVPIYVIGPNALRWWWVCACPHQRVAAHRPRQQGAFASCLLFYSLTHSFIRSFIHSGLPVRVSSSLMDLLLDLRCCEKEIHAVDGDVMVA